MTFFDNLLNPWMIPSHIICAVLVFVATLSIVGCTHHIQDERAKSEHAYCKKDWVWDAFLALFAETFFLVLVGVFIWTLENPPSGDTTRIVGRVGEVTVTEVDRPGDILPGWTSTDCVISNWGSTLFRLEGINSSTEWVVTLGPGEVSTIRWHNCPKVKVYSNDGGLIGMIK